MPRKGAMPLPISSQRSLGPEPLTVTTAGKGPFPTGRTIVPCRLITPLELQVVRECVSVFAMQYCGVAGWLTMAGS